MHLDTITRIATAGAGRPAVGARLEAAASAGELLAHVPSLVDDLLGTAREAAGTTTFQAAVDDRLWVTTDKLDVDAIIGGARGQALEDGLGAVIRLWDEAAARADVSGDPAFARIVQRGRDDLLLAKAYVGQLHRFARAQADGVNVRFADAVIDLPVASKHAALRPAGTGLAHELERLLQRSSDRAVAAERAAASAPLTIRTGEAYDAVADVARDLAAQGNVFGAAHARIDGAADLLDAVASTHGDRIAGAMRLDGNELVVDVVELDRQLEVSRSGIDAASELLQSSNGAVGDDAASRAISRAASPLTWAPSALARNLEPVEQLRAALLASGETTVRLVPEGRGFVIKGTESRPIRNSVVDHLRRGVYVAGTDHVDPYVRRNAESTFASAFEVQNTWHDPSAQAAHAVLREAAAAAS